MKKDFLLEELHDCKEHSGVVTFYVRYKEADNIWAQKWGTINKFDEELARIEASPLNICGRLPIEKIIFYGKACINAYIKNPLYEPEPVDDDEYSDFDAYVHINVPYMDAAGNLTEMCMNTNNCKF